MKNNKNPIVILYPPPSDPTQSYTSLPSLTGYLRSYGFQVVQRDLSIELFSSILTKEFLSNAAACALSRAQKSIDSPNEINRNFINHFNDLFFLTDYIIDHINEAREIMKDAKKFYILEQYNWAVNIIFTACELASLSCHPTIIYPNNYKSTIDLTIKNLLDATKKNPENFYYDLFEKKIIPEIIKLNPLLVGLSITYHFQIIPALTLSRLLKTTAPGLHVTIGGAIVSRMESQLLCNSEVFQFADTFVIGEGETALRLLSESLLKKQIPYQIPNLITKVNGRPCLSHSGYIEDIGKLPCPDFDGIELESYFSPEPVILIPSSRGCYHGKCTFCDVSMNTRSVHRPIRRLQFSQNIKSLYARYGVRRFFFCDDAVPPKNLLEISKLVSEECPDITWQAEVRFEKTFTEDFVKTIKNGGCRQLMFGLESTSQRVLDKMNKNNIVENDLKVLELCKKNGIAVNLQTFIGFPTETHEEANQTIKFLINNERNIASIGFSTFSLYNRTPVFENPHDYGVNSISSPLQNSLVSGLDFRTSSGLSREDVQTLHDSALEKLKPIYLTRSHYLAGASGAHSLLHFSHYGYDEMYKNWKNLDSVISNYPDLYDMIPEISSDVFLKFNTYSSSYPVFHKRTGNRVYLSKQEGELLQLCDGQLSVGKLADIWINMQDDNLDDVKRTFTVAFFFKTVQGFICNKILVPKELNYLEQLP